MKYYSFLTGTPGTSMAKWVDEDIKIPAKSIREAIILHHLQTQLRYKYQKNFHIKDYVLTEPSKDLVYAKYRIVFEFEKRVTNPNHKCRHDYKLLRKIPVHRFCNLFEEYPRNGRL